MPGAEQFWIPSGAVLEGDKDCPSGGRGRTEVPTGAAPPPPFSTGRQKKTTKIMKTVSRDEFFRINKYVLYMRDCFYNFLFLFD